MIIGGSVHAAELFGAVVPDIADTNADLLAAFTKSHLWFLNNLFFSHTHLDFLIPFLISLVFKFVFFSQLICIGNMYNKNCDGYIVIY